jgi:pilus assembly protein CpaE
MIMAHDWLRILAVVRSPAMQRQLAEALGERQGGGLDLRLGELAGLAPGLLQAASADVLLLEIDAEDPANLDALNRLTVEAAAKGLPVLVTARDLGTAGMRRLLREGVTDFIPQPLAAQDVVDALTSAARKLVARQGEGARGRVLTFSRASGGTGATTLAVNAAWLLAQPQRGKQAKVCVIDLDLQFGATALHLDLKPQAGLLEMARAPERLDAALFQGSLVEHPSGLRALTAPPLPMPLDAMRTEVVSRLLELARAEFDFVVVDLPLALTAWTDAALSGSDLVFLVTRPDVPAVRQLRRMLEVFQDEGLYSLPLRLVLNRELVGFGWGGGTGVRRRQVESALGRTIDFALPDEPEVVSEALNRGRPIFEVKRRSRIGKRLRAMVERAVAELPARAAGVLPAAA